MITFRQTSHGRYVCNECGQGNWSRANMERHVAELHQTCEWCGCSFVGIGAHRWRCPARPLTQPRDRL